MKLSLQNRGNGTADIISYTGITLKMEPKQILPLDEPYSSDLEKYYSQLRKVDIYLLKRSDTNEASALQTADKKPDIPIKEEIKPKPKAPTAIKKSDDEMTKK